MHEGAFGDLELKSLRRKLEARKEVCDQIRKPHIEQVMGGEVHCDREHEALLALPLAALPKRLL